jgi:hypothetical protein
MKNRKLMAFLAVAAIMVGGCSKRNEPVVIEPGVAIGSVHSGMTIQQVIAGLGQPNQTIDSVLIYSHLGLQVAPGKGDVVHRVTIAQPFAGRTKEGIGIGSSRAEVIRAYGEPAVDKQGTADMISVFFQASK